MENTNKVYTATMKFASAEGQEDFLLEVEWDPSLREALDAVGGNEELLPASYKMMLTVIGRIINPGVAYSAELGMPVEATQIN